MLDLKGFSTETRNPNTLNLDTMTPLELVDAMNQEDAHVIEAVGSQRENIATIIEWATESLYAGGRIIYMGARTSGRLGVLDAVLFSEASTVFFEDTAKPSIAETGEIGTEYFAYTGSARIFPTALSTGYFRTA